MKIELWDFKRACLMMSDNASCFPGRTLCQTNAYKEMSLSWDTCKTEVKEANISRVRKGVKLILPSTYIWDSDRYAISFLDNVCSFSRPNLETLLQPRLQCEIRELLPRVETLRAEGARLRGRRGHPEQVRVAVVAPLRRPEVGGGPDYAFQTLELPTRAFRIGKCSLGENCSDGWNSSTTRTRTSNALLGNRALNASKNGKRAAGKAMEKKLQYHPLVQRRLPRL